MFRLLKAAQDEVPLPVDAEVDPAEDAEEADKAKLLHRQPGFFSVWPGFLRNQ